MPSLYEQLGGERKLRAIIDDFIDRVFDDTMIGFFFARANKSRIKEKELELAAEMLGAGTPYTGRPLDEAHAPHPIMGGQFARRKKILEEVLEAHEVATAIRVAWLEHTERLRPLITRDAGSDCDEDAATQKGGV